MNNHAAVIGLACGGFGLFIALLALTEEKKWVRIAGILIGATLVFAALLVFGIEWNWNDGPNGKPLGAEALVPGEEHIILSLSQGTEFKDSEVANQWIEILVYIPDEQGTDQLRFIRLDLVGLEGELPPAQSYTGWTIKLVKDEGFRFYTLTSPITENPGS